MAELTYKFVDTDGNTVWVGDRGTVPGMIRAGEAFTVHSDEGTTEYTIDTVTLDAPASAYIIKLVG